MRKTRSTASFRERQVPRFDVLEFLETCGKNQDAPDSIPTACFNCTRKSPFVPVQATELHARRETRHPEAVLAERGADFEALRSAHGRERHCHWKTRGVWSRDSENRRYDDREETDPSY